MQLGIQEVLANALGHAHANLIKVKLDIAPASVRLEIFDDGEGLTVPEFGARLRMRTDCGRPGRPIARLSL